jgi:hypothetical protein
MQFLRCFQDFEKNFLGMQVQDLPKVTSEVVCNGYRTHDVWIMSPTPNH